MKSLEEKLSDIFSPEEVELVNDDIKNSIERIKLGQILELMCDEYDASDEGESKYAGIFPDRFGGLNFPALFEVVRGYGGVAGVVEMYMSSYLDKHKLLNRESIEAFAVEVYENLKGLAMINRARIEEFMGELEASQIQEITPGDEEWEAKK